MSMKKALNIIFIALFILLPVILSDKGINLLGKIFLVNLINYQEWIRNDFKTNTPNHGIIL